MVPETLVETPPCGARGGTGGAPRLVGGVCAKLAAVSTNPNDKQIKIRDRLSFIRRDLGIHMGKAKAAYIRNGFKLQQEARCLL